MYQNGISQVNNRMSITPTRSNTGTASLNATVTTEENRSLFQHRSASGRMYHKPSTPFHLPPRGQKAQEWWILWAGRPPLQWSRTETEWQPSPPSLLQNFHRPSHRTTALQHARQVFEVRSHQPQATLSLGITAGQACRRGNRLHVATTTTVIVEWTGQTQQFPEQYHYNTNT